MYNFVVFSLSRWNIEYGCNIKDICIELSKNHKVLYIDVPLKRKDRWLRRDSAAVKEVVQRVRNKKHLQQVNQNLWHYIDEQILESVNSITNNWIFDVINKVNAGRFANVILRATKSIGFTDFILLNDNDIYNGYYLYQYLKPKLAVYYLRDRLPAMKYWSKHAGRLEPTLITNSDLVLTNSEYLKEYAARFNSESYYVGQGCEVEHFLIPPSQPKILDIPRPIVGYIGALNGERLNIDLIFHLATSMPQLSFVFIGHEDSIFLSSRLHELSNVYFLGAKEFNDLPSYLYQFDVAINPQKFNEITVGNYPRKVDEYLASGKPVVNTKTDAMRPFTKYVYLAETPSEFANCILLALKEDSELESKRRKEFAATHTWRNSVAEMLKHIGNSINKKLGHTK
ncbi:MAG: glycosyltransferase [Cyclobacteriaceae bacterium]|nr:glycosyltransferase [Cyclobacteriaceae bacterium]